MRSSRCPLLFAALMLAASTQVAAQNKAANGNGKSGGASAPDTVILEGAPFGSVKFVHVTHEKMTQCVNCHHDSRAEKPLTSAHQKCGVCHAKTAVAPMKTTIRDAFHDVKAKSGTCMDCHVKRVVRVKGVPVTCRGCHIKTT